MNFNLEYPIEDLKPADYNPREISDPAFEMLKDSILKYGMVKPIILNGTGILTAGHQRIKASKELGLKTVPAILLKNISIHDEIKFNLFHNSIETNKTYARIISIAKYKPGYNFIAPEDYECGENNNAAVTKHISDLYLRYGNWGSVVADTSGKIILNSDYAYSMKIYNQPLLAYIIDELQTESFLERINLDYGEYNYDALKIKPYVQYHCQMNRVKTDEHERVRSTLYETIVLERITPELNVIDFGAGKFRYVDYLKSKGYNIVGYEPYINVADHTLDIKKVVADLDKIYLNIILSGMFDAVILDSVLNSITSLEYEKAVLTCCNALLKNSGTLFLATRSLETIQRIGNFKKITGKPRAIEFLDKNNFSGTFREGNWTLQRFHTKESLKILLSEFFIEVEITQGKSQNYAVCRGPKALVPEQYEKALETELNIEYPNNFRHNKHSQLKKMILEKLRERNEPYN